MAVPLGEGDSVWPRLHRVGVVYSMNDRDFPLDFYLRVAPGLQVIPAIDFYFSGYLGALWRFN